MPFVEDFSKKGDLVVEFDIEFPKSLNPDSKELLKKALIPNAHKKEDNGKPKKSAIPAKSSDFDE